MRLEVFNLLGQRIATLVEGEQPAGVHTAVWDATDGSGQAVGAGVYLYRLTVGGAHQTGRMVLVDGQAGVLAVGGASVWSGASGGGGATGEGVPVYGLVVSGSGIAPYAVADLGIQAGMAPVELVVEAHPAGKALGDDDSSFDLSDLFNTQEEEEEDAAADSQGGPDLIIASVSVSDTTLTPGQAFTLKAKVRNQGDDPSAATTLRYYRSTDATITSDAEEMGTDSIGALNPSAVSRVLISLTAPASAGTYYYGACVESVADESDTDNNCSQAVTISVDAPVSIPDANLRAVIEAALGKASGALITVSEMATLTSLDVRNKGIRSLTGLEFATNLTSLDLGAEDVENGPINSNDISNLSPLSGLTNLTWLILNRNSVSDISALSGLTNLTWLHLWDNSVSDLSPLSGLTNLTGLDLNGNGVSDISALSGLTNLTWLVLMVNSVSDISPLVANTGLGSGDEVYLWRNPLSCPSLNTHIPALQSRGVIVHFDNTDNNCSSDSSGTSGGEQASLLDVLVADRFGRAVNDTGITLVDWEGYIANPAMKYTVKVPSGVTTTRVILSSSAPRVYFNRPSWNGAEGPRKELNLSGTSSQAEFYISIFPDRDGLDETHSLTIEYRDTKSRWHTQTIDIHVIDQDVPNRALDFDITLDFSQDQTALSNDSAVRETVQQAADDWAYFIDDMDLDQVSSGQEESWIWDSRGYSHGGKPVKNKMSYTGFLLYAYGVHDGNGGQPSYGSYQSSNGVGLPLRRSGNTSIDTRGNYNTLGWMTLLPDEEWWKGTNFGDVQNDLYSIVFHEVGHALVFNPGYDEFDKFKKLGYINDTTVRDYYGKNPAISPGLPDHLPDTIDPASRRGAYGNEYGGEMPPGRWIITKGHLVIAEAIGYALRETSPFIPLSITAVPLPEGTSGTSYSYTATVSGGTPAYYWKIESGALPEGLSIDSFTGTISGTPKQHGTFNFTISVSDCDETTPSITRAVTLIIKE